VEVAVKTFASAAHDANNINGLSVFTLVLWMVCSLVGGLGFAIHYTHPHPHRSQPPQVKVEMLEVKLADDPEPTPEASQNPSVTDSPTQPQIPQPIAVAQPSPAIAFALLVQGPVQIVAPRFAARTQATPTPAPAPGPTPQKLAFGEGEGRQPKPDYPQSAQRAGEEGTVTVRFTVAETGHVTAAEIVEPCRWPILNQSALRAVRERWRFVPGTIRMYDVPIRFQLTAE
jgi:TonB family protein